MIQSVWIVEREFIFQIDPVKKFKPVVGMMYATEAEAETARSQIVGAPNFVVTEYRRVETKPASGEPGGKL